MAQLVGKLSGNQKVPGSTPGQDTYICCGFNPQSRSESNSQSRYIWEVTSWCFSLAWIFLSLPSCLSKSNEKNVRGWIKKRKQFQQPTVKETEINTTLQIHFFGKIEERKHYRIFFQVYGKPMNGNCFNSLNI